MVVDEPESVKKEPEAPKAKGSLRKAIALTVVVLLTIAATFAGGIVLLDQKPNDSDSVPVTDHHRLAMGHQPLVDVYAQRVARGCVELEHRPR